MLVRRAIVGGVLDGVKTKYSNAGMPLDPQLAEILLHWRRKSTFAEEEDWLFAGPLQNGRMLYRAWGAQRRRIRPVALAAGLGNVGWHTLPHSFSGCFALMARISKCSKSSCGTLTSEPR
jgi:integrase